MSEIALKPIGIINSPYQETSGMPIQPVGGKGVKGKVVLNPEYQDGLKDLEGFSHLILIYRFHKTEKEELLVKPFLDDQIRGVFSSRAPSRPNRIGISVVKLLEINGNILEIEDLDLLDQTPLLDIKPYVPEFDPSGPVRLGWLEKRKEESAEKLSDDRFQGK